MHLCLFTEFAENGSLNGYISDHKEGIEQKLMLHWATQIAKGMLTYGYKVLLFNTL